MLKLEFLKTSFHLPHFNLLVLYTQFIFLLTQQQNTLTVLHPISKYQFFFKHHSSGWFYNQNWISSSIKLMKQWSNQLNMYKKKFLCIFLCLSLSLFVTGWFNSHTTQILYLNNRNICSLTISDPKQSLIHVCLNYLEFFHLYHRSTIYRKKISWSHSVYISTHSSELLGLVVTWSPTIKVSLKGFQPQVLKYNSIFL